jgi:hypothetical protein
VKREQPLWKQRQVATLVNPFFWTLCEVCRKEFRREAGWRLRRYAFSIDGANTEHVYACAECCPTEHEAYAVLVGCRP